MSNRLADSKKERQKFGMTDILQVLLLIFWFQLKFHIKNTRGRIICGESHTLKHKMLKVL